MLLLQVFADPRTAEEDGRVWSSLFIVLAVFAGIAGFLRTFCFSVSGEALTARLRGMSFKAIMRQVKMKEFIYCNDHFCCLRILGGLIWNKTPRVPSQLDCQRMPVKYKE